MSQHACELRAQKWYVCIDIYIVHMYIYMYINAPSLRLPPFCKSTVLKFSGILPIDLNPRADNNTTPPVRVDGTAPREISFVIRFLSVLMFTNLKAVMPYMFWLQLFIFTKWNLQTTPKLAIIHIHKGNLQTTPKLEIWLSTRIPMSLATRILSSWSVSFKNKCIYIYTSICVYTYIYIHVYHNSLPIFIWIWKKKLLGPLDPYHPITPRSIHGSVDPNILLMEMARQACGLQGMFGLTRTGYPRKPTRLMFLNRFFQRLGLLSWVWVEYILLSSFIQFLELSWVECLDTFLHIDK